jgi:HD superfamily phosphohydrolase
LKGDRFQVYDPVYGHVNLPAYLRPFLEAPEFRRLGFIRLLNFESLELAAISEARRLSHTLGVLHLATRVTSLRYSSDEFRALLCAVVLHDIGTPPFGHTLEYEFIRRYNLDHEGIATKVLDLKHHWLAADHQIFRGLAVELSKAVRATGLEEIIRQILGRLHPLSKFLFGDIDLDNIDNVYRMSRYLGFEIDPAVPLELASSIDIDKQGRIYLAKSKTPLVEDWLRLRAASYRIILNTQRHRQNQAIFSRIVYEALEQNLIDDSDWFATDERLLKRLDEAQSLRSFFRDLYANERLKEYSYRVDSQISLSRRLLLEHRDRLTALLQERTGKKLYVAFSPYGEVLSRRLSFIDPTENKPWTIGSPEPTYHLHVYVRSSTLSGRSHQINDAIKEEIKAYVEEQGWHIDRPSLEVASA